MAVDVYRWLVMPIDGWLWLGMAGDAYRWLVMARDGW